MTRAECIALVLMAILVALMVAGLRKLEKRQREWEWLHPPQDDLTCEDYEKEADE